MIFLVAALVSFVHRDKIAGRSIVGTSFATDLELLDWPLLVTTSLKYPDIIEKYNHDRSNVIIDSILAANISFHEYQAKQIVLSSSSRIKLQ